MAIQGPGGDAGPLSDRHHRGGAVAALLDQLLRGGQQALAGGGGGAVTRLRAPREAVGVRVLDDRASDR